MTIEVTAKKVEDAINQGLKQLGVSLDRVSVEVVEAGGLFRKAKVRLTLDGTEENAEPQSAKEPVAAPDAASSDRPKQKAESAVSEKSSEPETKAKADGNSKPTPANREKSERQRSNKPQPASDKADKKPNSEKSNAGADKKDKGVTKAAEKPESPRKQSAEDKVAADHALEFIKNVTQKMGFADLNIQADKTGELISIDAPAGDDSLLIGRHGETLSALSYLAETCARAEKSRVSITVDCNGYRDRRAASLTAMARRRADECVAKHRKIKLEPMERVDRRTVHNALTGDDRVSTASEGKEPYRSVVIIPR